MPHKLRPCRGCESTFTRSRNSDRVYCDDCVGARVWEQKIRPSALRKTCALCGTERPTSRSSLPQGQYICHPCRRSNPEHRERLRIKRNGIGSAKDSRKRAQYFGVEYEYVNRHKVYVRDKWRCGICTGTVDKALAYPDPLSASLDHVVPMSCDGGHTYANTQCSHLKCNIEKSNRGHAQQLALI